MRAILLDNIRSMLNVGAIFRTADGAGYDRVYLTGVTPTPPRREISKTALGAEESVPWEYYRDAREILSRLKSEGWHIVALEQTPESIDYRSIHVHSYDHLCIVVGSETEGVSQELSDFIDSYVELPMLGIKKSLNVATAAGILIYSWINENSMKT
ncbi:MAG TPA: RNA methyltransferase [bacterium]|nr:RNA methyltransferase [bacterium]